MLAPSIALVALVALVAIAPAAGMAASPAPSLPFPMPPPSSSEGLAGQLVVALYPADAAVETVAITVVVTDPPQGSAPERFVAHLGDALEVALRRRASVRARARSAEAADERVEVRVAIEQGQVVATARRVRLPQNLWQRLDGPDGVALATAFSVWPLDLELRTLLGLERRAVRLDALRVVPVTDKTAALAPAPILDLLIEDLDGDLVPELIVLQPTSVRVLRWQAGGFSVERGRYPLDGLPPNPARVRQPLGRLVAVTRADGTRLVIAASSDRAVPAFLVLPRGGGLAPADLPDAPTGWPLYATGVDAWLTTDWPQGTDLLGGAVAEQRASQPEGGGSSAAALMRLDALGGAYDVRAFGLRAPSSPTWSPHLALVGPDATLRVWGSDAEAVEHLARTGTVVVVADLDGDGGPEILTTSDGLGPRDRLTLYRALAGARAPRRLWSAEVRAPVTAAASGDVDRDGYHEFVVALWDGRAPELLIVVPRT